MHSKTNTCMCSPIIMGAAVLMPYISNCQGPCYLVVRTFERLLMDVNVTDSMGSIAPPKCSIRRNRGKETEKQERMTERN